MISWVIYAVVVSGLLTLAALLLERMVHAIGGPVRWAWSGAMMASVSLPALLGLAAARTVPSARLELSTLSPGVPVFQIMPLWPELAGAGAVLDGERVTKRTLEGLDPDGVDRVEVVKGGAAEAPYGAEAAGGVIQIFLRQSGSETDGRDPFHRPGSGS